MKTVPVFYATSEGQTRRIAEVIAATLREEGFQSEAEELTPRSPHPDWRNVIGAVVGGSLHGGRHQRVLEQFVVREADALAARPAAFFSVSLAAASRNPAEVAAAQRIADRFVRDAGWTPERMACIAGRLAYTHYGFFTRWMMRRIAAREGGPTDTSRDHEFTDWAAVRAFARGVAADARAVGRMAS